MVEIASNSERSPRPRSVRRSNLNALPRQNKRKQPRSNNDASDAEPVVTKQPAAKQKITATNSKKPVGAKKRKKPASKEDSE